MERTSYHHSVFPWEDPSGEVDILEDNQLCYQLVLWNDDVNTFEWVIETLVDICGHTPEQAEQCALFIHTKGRYGVKNGNYGLLKPMRDAIVERGINATIEHKK